MLVEYKIRNFRSLRNPAVLSFIPCPNGKEEAKPMAALKSEELLKEAVIFGANGSGKSALLASMKVMQSLLNDSVAGSPGNALHQIEPFGFDEKSRDLPAAFEVWAIVNDLKFVYGFSATQKEVVEEYLYLYTSSRASTVFERTGQDYKAPAKWKKYLSQYQSLVQPDSLFLGVAGKLSAEGQGKILADIYSWLTESIHFSTPKSLQTNGAQALRDGFLKQGEWKNKMLDLIRLADFSIYDFQVRLTKANLNSFLHSQEEKSQSAKPRRTAWSLEEKIDIIHLLQGKEYVLPLKKEGAGFQKYFFLLFRIIQTLEEGGVLVIDEMEASLHPFLVKEITDLFRDKITNPNNAQLIFTTHDVLLLEIGHFRPDEIWFMEKSRGKLDAQLYSLADLSLRREKDYLNNYLLGRYGGVPYLLTSWLEED